MDPVRFDPVDWSADYDPRTGDLSLILRDLKSGTSYRFVIPPAAIVPLVDYLVDLVTGAPQLFPGAPANPQPPRRPFPERFARWLKIRERPDLHPGG